MTTNQIEQDKIASTDEQYIFMKGLPGFVELRKFKLQAYNEVFSLLKSVEEPLVAFITVNPFDFYPDYEFRLSEDILEEMDITDEAHVSVRCIVTWHSDPEKSSVNLLAPLIFNNQKFTGKQIVLQNSGYTTKQILWNESNSIRMGGES